MKNSLGIRDLLAPIDAEDLVLVQARIPRDLREKTKIQMRRDNKDWADLISACFQSYLAESGNPKKGKK